jgi:hypothetical protein
MRRGKPDAAGDGGRRHRVRGRDDPAQGQRRGERDVQEPPDHEPDTERREDDQADRQQPDDPLVGPQVDQRGADGCGIQQGREDAEEDDLGTHLDLRDRRDERDDRTDRDEKQWRRRAGPSRRR